jgi:hypothetical protein
MSNQSALIPVQNQTTAAENSLSGFHQQLEGLLKHFGLPETDLFAPLNDRLAVVQQLDGIFSGFNPEQLGNAKYLSKFVSCVTIGLFDGAINFVWNETIESLRKLIIEFDLSYCLKVAEEVSKKYKNFSDAEDLQQIGDADLLEICYKIELISDVNLKRLQHVNYLRNHASAAHPNNNEVTGRELVALLENCVKFAINAKPEKNALRINRLFKNILENKIKEQDITVVSNELGGLSKDRTESFLKQLFGVYMDEKKEESIKSVILKIVPPLWEKASKSYKFEIGDKYSYHQKHGESNLKDLVDKFLIAVNGVAYRGNDVNALEFRLLIEKLKDAHSGLDNYYSEPPAASNLRKFKENLGLVPEQLRRNYVEAIVLCYIGNGNGGYSNGVAKNAMEDINYMINQFSENEVKAFALLFQEQGFTNNIYTWYQVNRIKEVIMHHRTKVTDSNLIAALRTIYSSNYNTVRDLPENPSFQVLIRALG